MWQRETGTAVRRAAALPGQTAAPFVILAESQVPPVPTEWAPHSHHLHELVWVRGGTLTSLVEGRVFTVSEGHGLWMPAGVVHGGGRRRVWSSTTPSSLPIARRSRSRGRQRSRRRRCWSPC
ncbi:AraC family ligand binding domain-containing protein [Streptomyces sp. NBC_01591]|nr:AraC family ligand binding domain-containing protein [Streptomyces sp. NBC_01591]